MINVLVHVTCYYTLQYTLLCLIHIKYPNRISTGYSLIKSIVCISSRSIVTDMASYHTFIKEIREWSLDKRIRSNLARTKAGRRLPALWPMPMIHRNSSIWPFLRGIAVAPQPPPSTEQVYPPPTLTFLSRSPLPSTRTPTSFLPPSGVPWSTIPNGCLNVDDLLLPRKIVK